MKIILLSGAPHSGKTTTLNMVYDQMTSGMSPLTVKTKLVGDPNDFECDFVYQGKQVAIFTMGDLLYCLTLAIIKYSQMDVLILAHHTGGPKWNDFVTNVMNCPHHIIVPKTINNQQDCATIISHI